MKKLTIEIPEWGEGKPIHINIAKESYMHVGRDGRVWKKIIRCDKCGKCCRLHPDSNWSYPKYEIDGETYCIWCEKQPEGTFHCTCPQVPWGCCSDNPSNRRHKGKSHPECCVEYETVGSI